MSRDPTRAAALAEPDQVLDTRKLNCPMPLLKTKLALNNLPSGARLLVIATDPGSARDIPAYIALSNHRLLEQGETEATYRFLIERR